ncbi:MAG TPA: AAA family ATPase [Herpetosiphonaceae bacterium]
MSLDLIHIPSIQLLDEIGRGADSIVYRGRHAEGLFAVKVLRDLGSARAADTALRFRREAAVLARLRHPGIASVMEVGEAEGRTFLVMEYVEGPTLTQALDAGPLPEPQIVALGRGLADALAAIHRLGLVHRDVKPSNILFDGLNRPKLIDFGFAAQVNPHNPAQSIVGTFFYSAPEQTGMIKRPVDGRADLYALGVVLFECATGALPFESQDVGELIRQHAVAPPPGVRELNPAISPALAAIIARLLAKDPDDRYQSGKGLAADLDRLENFNAALAEGHQPALGARDEPVNSQFEAPLVGRSQEIGQLQELWNEARQGRGSMVLIEGETGIGKTRLVRELIHRAGGSRALALTGRCTDDPLPFEPLREAVDGYLRTIYALPDSQKHKAAEQVKAAAAGWPGLLRRFSPLLAGLLGEADETEAADESPEHFYDAIVDFLLRLSRFHAGLVLFIDDIHGIEDASAQVLKRLNAQAAQAPLLAVCAGSSDAGQPLGDLAHEIGLPPSQRLVLLPLTIDAVNRLVAGRLGGFELDRAIIRQLATRSHGNPFAVEEYVKSMLDAGLLRPAWGSWQVDAEGLEELKLPGDVVQLVVRRIEDLAPETIEILRAAAVLGARFRLDLLPAICGVDEDDINMAVIEAAGEHLLERGAGGEYVFVHARVQEALLSQLDAEAQRRIHRAIAGVLDRRGGDGEAHVYALARHYALGGISANPERTYQANVAAGRLALADYAHQEAYDFLSQALAAADLGAITPDAGVEATMGEVCVQTARMNEAVGHFKRSVAQAREPAQRAFLLGRLANAYLAQYRTIEAWEHLEKAFRELGATPPQTTPRQVIGALAEWRRGRKLKKSGERRQHTPREREQLKTKLSLYEIGGRTLFFNLRDELLLAQTIIRQLATAQQMGPSRELALAIGQYATLLNLFKRMKAADELIEEARAVAESQGDRQALAYVALNHALGKHLAGAALDAERLMRRSITEHGTWLDGGDYLRACLDLAWNLLMRGYVREAQEWLQLARARAEQTRAFGEEMAGHPLTFYSGSTLVALGKPAEGLALLEQGREYLESIPFDQYRWGWGNYLGHQMLAALELGDPAEALDELLAIHRRLNLRPGRVRLHLRHFYVFHAYARLALAAAAPPGEPSGHRGPLLEPLRAAVAQLKLTATLPALRCHYLAAAGGLKRLEGQSDEALKLLAAGAAEARDIDSPWALFEIARQRAAILAERGNSAGARREAYLAHDLAAEHGWPQRLRRVRAEFQIVESSSGKTSNRPTTTSRGTSTQHSSSMSSSGSGGSSSLKLQRYLDALLQVSLAAATVFDPDLQARAALDEIVRILGAERAFLFTAREGSDQLDLKAGRDASRQDLAELAGYSRTVVERVRATRQPTVISGTDEGALLGSESVVTNNLRSIIAAPLLLRERLVGVVYLDNRLARGVFTEDDVSILLAVANHIAINFETARAVQKNQALLGAIPDLMFRIDRDGRFLEFIAAKGDDSGLPAHTYVGKNVEEVWPPELAGRIRAQLAQTLSDGQPQVIEYQLQGRRKVRDFEARIVASGEHEVLALVRDITERKENDRVKDEFITIVSHQLRTPLTSMTMSLEMLSRGIGGPLPDTSKMMLDVAYKNSSRLAKLINMMLDIMRIKSGESEFELETLELAPLLDEALEKAAPLAEQFGVSFAADPVQPGLPLRVDAERLVQALGHLLEYAVRFSPPGTPVTVSVEPGAASVRLAVRDEGPGIPEELRERIFQSFAQANVNIEDSQHQGSAGLGLSVTKAIIDRLNGQIWFETAAGAGTTFYVELPLADNPAT